MAQGLLSLLQLVVFSQALGRPKMQTDHCKAKAALPEPQIQGWVETLPEALDLRQTIEHIERVLILRALKAAGGVQAEAARRLGLSRSDIAYKRKKYGLSA